MKKLGTKAVFEKALQQVTNGTKAFGVSVDLDGFDPSIAPGTGTPEPDGLPEEEVLQAINRLCHHPLFRAFEIAELNPIEDVNNKTLMLTQKILENVVIDE